MKKCIPFVFFILLMLPSPTLPEELPLWEIGIGGAALHQPDYRGSDESRFYAIPFPYVVYRGEIFTAEGSRLSGLLFKSDRLRFDLSLSGSFPVSNDNQAREGMDDVDFTGEIGPSLEWKIFQNAASSLWLKTPLRGAFSLDSTFQGIRFAPYLEYDWTIPPLPEWKMSLSAGPTFGTERYHDYFYEVEAKFARPGRPEYHPSGGYSGSTAGFGVSRRYKDLRISAFTRYDNLSGAAFEDSPLVKTVSYWSAGFTLTWFFAKSKILVKTPSGEAATPVMQLERPD